MNYHVPVLLHEVVESLDPKPNQLFIDGTVGQGGHAEAILERILPVVPPNKKTVRFLGIDRDASNLAIARKRLKRFGQTVVFVHDSYTQTSQHAFAHHLTSVNGIFLDLGFASVHVDDPIRGFSFREHGPLDMRYDTSRGITAAQIVAEWSEDELARIFRQYGEEPQARAIAQAIVKERKRLPITSTVQLAEFVEGMIRRKGSLHPATRVFQALRIATNDELSELTRALPELVRLLAPKGRVAIITFHSIEDRIVKQYFQNEPSLRVVNRKVIVPNRQEILANPRARSAKLRVAEKI